MTWGILSRVYVNRGKTRNGEEGGKLGEVFCYGTVETDSVRFVQGVLVRLSICFSPWFGCCI